MLSNLLVIDLGEPMRAIMHKELAMKRKKRKSQYLKTQLMIEMIATDTLSFRKLRTRLL